MSESRRVAYPAHAYDRYTERFVRPYDRLLHNRVVGEFRRLPGARDLLDIGTGTAQVLIQLAAIGELDPLHFVGIDFDPAMVAVSRANVAASQLEERIDVTVADVHSLPFRDDAFDLAISRSTIHHWADPVSALREIRRVLRPGGVAIVHDVRRDAPGEAVAAFDAARAEANVPPSNLAEKHTADAVRAFIRAAGLEREAVVRSAPTGVASLGFEVRLRKGPPAAPA